MVRVPDGRTFNPKEPPTQVTTVSSLGGRGTPPPLPPPPITGPGWQDSNFRRAFQIENRRGRDPQRPQLPIARLVNSRGFHLGPQLFNIASPRALHAEPRLLNVDAGVGNGNYQLAVPVLSLAGRRQDLSLVLFYNAKVWLKTDDQTIAFDHDHDWPAPGWSLGFGKVERMGSYGVGLEDPDGTIHPFAGKVDSYASGYTNFASNTIDGTLIDCFFQLFGGALSTGSAKWPNGTEVSYGAPSDAGNVMYPNRIIDANGNYITITYRNNTGPDIHIVDTLGRVIEFHYDSSNRLTAVTAPGVEGGSRTVLRLHYSKLALAYAFDPKIKPVVRADDWRIDAIYFPATSTGYWFGDTDSYSSYGMIAKVSQRRGMTLQTSSLTDQGIITPGNVTRERTYNYPLFPNLALTDAPTYTAMGEIWEGMDVPPAVTNYTTQMDANPRRVDVIYPDGTHVTQLLINDPGQFDDGLLFQQSTYDTSGNLLRQSTTSWEQGDYYSPRVKTVSVTDQRNQTTTTAYSYSSSPYP